MPKPHLPMLYTRFERFWHWSQAALILVLLFTGFNIHGTFQVLDFQKAFGLHVFAALALIVLWVFAIFWHLTTGQWRHYVPTSKNLLAMAKYYAWGIFRHAPHPVKKTYQRKHNPLQALTYLGLKLGVFPAIWITGLWLLLYQPLAGAIGGVSFGTLALIHTAVAFIMAAFIMVHVYLTTTGHTVFHHIRAMLTGYDDEVTSKDLIAPEGSD